MSEEKTPHASTDGSSIKSATEKSIKSAKSKESLLSLDNTSSIEITQFAQQITTASKAASIHSKTKAVRKYTSILSFASFVDLSDSIVSKVGYSTTNNPSTSQLPHTVPSPPSPPPPTTFHEILDQGNPQLNPFSPEFSAHTWAKHLVNAKIRDPERYPSRSAGISFENLGAYGYSKGTEYQKTVLNNLYQLQSLLSSKRRKGNRIDILKNFNGVVKKGETCVVLGRPGR